MPITPDQIRAARALLKWSQNDLADRSGVSLPTIANVEVEKQQANTSTQDKIVTALDEAGIELIEGGVRKRQDIVKVFEGDTALRSLQEDILKEMQKNPGEILFLGLVEIDRKQDPNGYELTKSHIQKLIDLGASEKILVKEGSTNFVAPKDWYRYMPTKYFSPHAYVIYGDKIALNYKEGYRKIMIIRSRHFSETLRKTYMMIWEVAEKPA